MGKQQWALLFLLFNSLSLCVLSNQQQQHLQPPPPPQHCALTQTANTVVLSNGYVNVQFNLVNPQIDVLQADFSGKGGYGANVVTGGVDPLGLGRRGVVLEVDTVDTQGRLTSTASSAGASSSLTVKVLANNTAQVVVLISGIVDSVASPTVSSTWNLTLNSGDRYLTLHATTTVLSAKRVVAVRISTYLGLLSIYSFFQKGIVQVMNSPNNYFASSNNLSRIYALGGGNAGFLCADFNPIKFPPEVVLLNADASGKFYRSGVQFVLAGSYPTPNKWDNAGWAKATPVTLSVNTQYQTSFEISPNNFDFPARQISSDIGIPFEQIRVVYTSVYSSPVGAILSYLLDSHIAPTIATPDHAYTDLYNFYDPDTYFSVSALVYSGDTYLLNEARKLVELSGNHILTSGQIPHHFIINEPTYVAISGATQTGPNLFWAAAAMLYAKNSADYVWLKAWWPKIQLAITFVTNLINPSVQLILAPGPLWIDVFIRANYTTDTNAFAVHVLRDAADAAVFLGDHTSATKYLNFAGNISNAINSRLWNTDHYITQLNPDGSTRDFVDYDSNLLVTAFNIAPPDRVAKVIARVDKGNCTHARATYVSEIFYDAKNCYGGNTGDSAVTMGRIGWVDALTRNNTKDVDTYNNLIYSPLVGDLFKTTWLYERYTCKAEPTHNNYYIEYPELLVMLTREITYGIILGFNSINIAPFAGGSTPFHYIIGNVDVLYSTSKIVLKVPGNGELKQVTVSGLTSGAIYTAEAGNYGYKATVDKGGVLTLPSVPISRIAPLIITQQ